jgi:hypothetical protein
LTGETTTFINFGLTQDTTESGHTGTSKSAYRGIPAGSGATSTAILAGDRAAQGINLADDACPLAGTDTCEIIHRIHTGTQILARLAGTFINVGLA